uniref:Uncharacterized protein n=1 Tax=Beihai levi-like virus 28 TaxID=1922414 RepID=A0A1L3KID3_9VIRU|nr:hypothetical protein [Beihai levi-like virus 28]
MKEAGETIDMVYHVFVRLWRTITKMIHAARSLNLAVTINSLSDLWLEYRYGWRPFLGEISSIAKQLAHIRNPNVLSSYGGQSAPAVTSVAQASSTVVTEHIRATVTHEIRPKSEISAKAGFNYVNNTDSRNTSTLALWGLDWHSLASTAWDLVPFSFVVDMFLNVSDVLQAHGIADEVKSFNGYISYTGEFRVVSKITSLQSSMPSTMRDYLSPSELIALGDSPFFAELFRVVDEQVRSLIFNSDGTYRSHKGYQTWTYYKNSESEALAAYQAQMTREGAYPVPDTVDLRRYGTSNYGVFFNSFFKWDKSDAAVKQIFTNKQGQIDYNARVIAVGATMYSFHELLGHLGQIADMVLEKNWNLRFDVRLWDSKVPEFGYRAACTVDYSGSEKYIDLSGKEPTYSYDMSIFQRVLNSELKHTLQASADLSSGQYIDLAAIGWNLIKSIKS